MIGTRTRKLHAALYTGAALAGLLAAPAQAQDAPAPASAPAAAQDDSAGPDIIITARRREESLLKVPVAVTAVTGAQLEKIGAVDLTDIQTVSPNTTLKDARGTNSTLAAFIRGVGQQDPVPGFEAGIGIYLDDVYLNRPQAAVLDIYDVDRIEVLRGPQGTLYGRNTIGGAVKYVTKRLPDTFSASLRGAYGSYNQADGIISLSAPIGSMLRVGVSGARLTRDGFGRNLTLGIPNYNKDIWAGRGTVEFETPDSGLFVRITGDYTHDKSAPRNGHRLFAGMLTGSPVLANVYDTNAGLNFPKEDVWAGGLSMAVTAKLGGGFTLRSISAWRKDRSFTPIDFDATPSVDVDVPAVYRNEQTSQEFQLLYASDKLNGLVGFYYLGAKAATGFDVLLNTTLANLDAYTAGDVRTETSSVFADFTYDFTPQLSLSVGGRYTWDQRKSFIYKANFLGGPLFGATSEFGGNPTLNLGASTNFRGEANFKRFTPRVSLSFKPNGNHMFYASYSEGFKGGGFDPRGSGTSAPDVNQDGVRSYQEIYNYLAFKPEVVKSFELGWKGSALDRRLTWSLAGFHANYQNVQIPGSVACIIGGVQSFCGITTNAAKARINGVEFEGNAVLARGFAGAGSNVTLSTAIGYIDPKYESYIGPTGAEVSQYRQFQNTPKWTLAGTLAANLPVGPGSINASTTVSYRSLTHQFEVASPFLDQPGYTLWDANLNYTFGSKGQYSIGLHAKNITDVRYKTAGYQYLAANAATGAIVYTTAGGVTPTLGKEGIATVFYGNPRQVFGTFSLKF
ncbi:MAG: TonB-dependent receptor [Sphingomonas sp.]|uniref:TonB-dependent receptor n=1 Tax=Sphingomonas sp. TaxID=28214 RepID=UPI00120713E4|nr:TonB-dependent receptor [Sphingomonas sp.]THD36082.1 MAG: TonB-dependent receptor [Sphingomonas sp.]